MRPRISITGSVRPSVRPLVGPSVGRSVGWSVGRSVRDAFGHAFAFRPSSSYICRVYGLVFSRFSLSLSSVNGRFATFPDPNDRPQSQVMTRKKGGPKIGSNRFQGQSFRPSVGCCCCCFPGGIVPGGFETRSASQ